MCYTRGMRKVLLLSLLVLAVAAPAAAQTTTSHVSGTVTVNGATSTYSATATVRSYTSGVGGCLCAGPPFKDLLPYIPAPRQGWYVSGLYIPTTHELALARGLREEMSHWVWPSKKAQRRLTKLRKVRHQIAPAAAPSGF